jgi:hypothetical protein
MTGGSMGAPPTTLGRPALHTCPAEPRPEDVPLLGHALLRPTVRGVRGAAIAGAAGVVLAPAGLAPVAAGALTLGLLGGVVTALHPGNSSCSVRRRALASAGRAGLALGVLALVRLGRATSRAGV